MGKHGVDVMRCNGLGNKMTKKSAEEMARMLKRYEIKKLQSYISIMGQLEEKLSLANFYTLPRNYSGEVIVCDGERISLRYMD